MDKFSKIQHKDKLPIEKEDFLYDGYIKVKEKSGWEYVSEKDCAIALVHLLDFDEILLRKEIVPPFNDKYPEQEFFLTVISGTIETGENPIQTITRELVEEAGILLNTTYMNYESWGKYFYCKGNSSQCHIYYIPLRTNDFRKVEASGDGSDFEEKSKTVRIDTKYLQALKPSDLITSLCIEKMKSKI
jgi:8-oxo-dGTP pyrophosphatase MutT (NUDIX family)